jgi:hypothetical protein
LCYIGRRTAKDTRHNLIFKGYWDIRDAYRLSYMLEGDSSSTFEFSAHLAKFDERKNAFLYTVSIGLKPVTQTVVLKGTWKIKKDLGLLFEVQYARAKTKAIVFGATCRLFDQYTVIARLRSNASDDLGLDISLSRNVFSRSGEVFLKAGASPNEWEITAGGGLRW